jgi:ABC-type uncharacterized transport system auxiliary subunit
MRKAAISFLAFALLSSCGSAPVKRYFQMALGEAGPRPVSAIARSLTVEPASVDPLYDDLRIRYRVSAFELEQYPYEFWAEKPGRLIDRAVADYFRTNHVFSRVSESGPGADAGIILRPTVRAIEEVDGQAAWEGRLAMSLEFQEAASGKILLTRTFDRRAAMKAKKVEELPAALSAILAEELTRAVDELAQVLGKQSP